MNPRALFLPGASGAATFWQPVADLLPETWEQELLGWPGLGSESPEPHVNGFEDVVRLVITRIERKDAGGTASIWTGVPVDLVAQSMGGVVAVQVALRRPDLVRRLVLVATSGGIDLAPFGALDWRQNYRRAFPAAAAWISELRIDVGDRLPTIAAPTLLIWGDADPISPPAVGEHLAGMLPDARLLVVAGGDHMLAHDRAAEIAPAIRDHLAHSGA